MSSTGYRPPAQSSTRQAVPSYPQIVKIMNLALADDVAGDCRPARRPLGHSYTDALSWAAKFG